VAVLGNMMRGMRVQRIGCLLPHRSNTMTLVFALFDQTRDSMFSPL